MSRPAAWRAATVRHRLGLLLTAVGSGLLLDAAFAPLSWWWAAPLGVAGLVTVLYGRRVRAGVVLGLAHGLGFFTPLLHFTAVSMGNVVGWLAVTVVESLYLAALGGAWAVAQRLVPGPGARWRGPAVRAVCFPVLWVAVEEVRSSWPWGGLPFGRLAFAMADAPVLPLASLAGSTGLGLLVALTGAVLAEGIRALRDGRRATTLVCATAACALTASPALVGLPERAEDGTVRVAAVQGNVAGDAEDAYSRALEVTRNHVLATVELAASGSATGVDLVIWPENAADRDPRQDRVTAVLVERAAQAVGVPVLVGAIAFADRPEGMSGVTGRVRYNDMVVWTPGSGAGQVYTKHRPVAFGEFVPLRRLIRAVSGQVDRIGSDLLPGSGGHTLTVRTRDGRDVPLAVGICFEVAYDDVLRAGVRQGGEVIVVPTNNASFGGSSEAAQQLAQGRVQAVTHGRAVVQVSTVGVTAVISPRGVVTQEARPYTRAYLVADVPLRRGLSVADRLGPWPARVVLAAATVLVLAGAAPVRAGAVPARANRPTRA